MVIVVTEFMTCFNVLTLSSGLELKYEAGADQNMQQSSAEKLQIPPKIPPNQIHKELMGFGSVQGEWGCPKPHQTPVFTSVLPTRPSLFSKPKDSKF